MSSVSYKITNKEAIDSFWFMIKNFWKYRISVIRLSVISLALPILIELIVRKSITSTSIVLGMILGLGSPFFLVYIARALAKKGEKTISVSQDGMEVSVGGKTKIIDWKLVSGVSESESYIFIISNGGNFMCVPKRAFTNETLLNEFVQVIVENA